MIKSCDKFNIKKYNIGDIINVRSGKIKIIKYFETKTANNRTIKNYNYKCLTCGYIGNTTEKSIYHYLTITRRSKLCQQN